MKITMAMVYLNTQWPAMVYEIYTLKFAFDLRWFHGILYFNIIFEILHNTVDGYTVTGNSECQCAVPLEFGSRESFENVM